MGNDSIRLQLLHPDLRVPCQRRQAERDAEITSSDTNDDAWRNLSKTPQESCRSGLVWRSFNRDCSAITVLTAERKANEPGVQIFSAGKLRTNEMSCQK